MKTAPAALVVAALGIRLAGAAETQAPPEQLLSKALGPTPVLDDLRELVDVIGGRPTGSKALENATLWAVGKLQAAGLENVHLESYETPRLWVPREEHLELTEPDLPGGSLRAAAMPFAANTPLSGLEADVVDAGLGDDSGFRSAGDLEGRWVLVHSQPMKSLDDLFKEYLGMPAILSHLSQGGAAGLLYMSNRPGRLLYRHNVTLDGSIYPIPCVLVEREGALRISRLVAAGGRVRVVARILAEIPEGRSASNVVGEIRGSFSPEEAVILGAHLDSWDLGRGALDNGCNAALVIDIARQMAALAKAGARPRRTLRFVLYSGEEAGLFGSMGEVRLHRKSLDQVRVQIVIDEGSGRISGFSLGGRSDLEESVVRALRPAAALGPFEHTKDAFVGTDNYDYLIEGVPTLVANQDGPPYLPDYHAESDTYDKVDEREVKINDAILSVLLWGLGAAQDLPKRQSRAEVEGLLKETGLDEQMRTFGLLDDFAKGRRGRAALEAPGP